MCLVSPSRVPKGCGQSYLCCDVALVRLIRRTSYGSPRVKSP
jgi:hypothetical protein